MKKRVVTPRGQPLPASSNAPNNSSQRKRGRPPTDATLELRRIEQMLASATPELRMTASEQVEFVAWLNDLERSERAILKEFRYGSNTPKAHAYAMSSLGDESMEGCEDKVKKLSYLDRLYKARSEEGRTHGVKTRIEERRSIKDQARDQFRHLWEKAKPSGRLSRSYVAQRIKRHWPPKHEDAPAESTLRGWIGDWISEAANKSASEANRKK